MRLDERQSSMGISYVCTIFFAASSRYVACPSLSGLKDSSSSVSSAGHSATWAILSGVELKCDV